MFPNHKAALNWHEYSHFARMFHGFVTWIFISNYFFSFISCHATYVSASGNDYHTTRRVHGHLRRKPNRRPQMPWLHRIPYHLRRIQYSRSNAAPRRLYDSPNYVPMIPDDPGLWITGLLHLGQVICFPPTRFGGFCASGSSPQQHTSPFLSSTADVAKG